MRIVIRANPLPESLSCNTSFSAAYITSSRLQTVKSSLSGQRTPKVRYSPCATELFRGSPEGFISFLFRMRKFLCSLLVLLTGILLYQLGYIRVCSHSYKGMQCKTYRQTEVVHARESSSSFSSSVSSVPAPKPKPRALNIDVLARAVSAHETCGCTCGIVLPEPYPDGVNNCFGIKDKNTGRPKDYASQEEAYADFKALWLRKYGGFPTLETASTYVGHDGSAWLASVTKYYDRYIIRP